jgi:hypothetical protein
MEERKKGAREKGREGAREGGREEERELMRGMKDATNRERSSGYAPILFHRHRHKHT